MKVTLHSKSVLCAGASALVLSAAAPAAIAQDQDTDQRTLSTVTVTATQRAESIQDVPIAVTALDPEALERAGVADIRNLDQVAPSFNMNTSDTQSGGITLRLRGVGTTGNNIGLESSVGVFLDGVYLSRPGIALADLLDLEQIEVLRGPQGTLFGRNTSAGALNIKTKAPSLENFEGFANATAGNYGLINVQGGVNIPVVEDKFGLRISGAYRERDGIIQSVPNDSESGVIDHLLFRGQGLFDMGENGSVRVILDYNESDDQCCDAVWHNDTSRAAAFAAPVGALGVGFPSGNIDQFGGAPAIIGPDLDNYFSNGDNFSETTESWGISAEYNVDTSLGALTYIGSFRNFQANSFRNTDFVEADAFTVGGSPEAIAAGDKFFPGGVEIETMTHELRLAGSAFDNRLDWIVGAYYSDEDITAAGSLTLLDDLQEYTALGINGGVADNIYNQLAQGVSTDGDFAANTFTQSGESISLFTHNVFALTDRIDLTLGLRYVDESKDGAFVQSGGEFDACNAYFQTVAAGAAPPVNLGNVIRLDELTTVINCFVFAAPAYDPANPGPVLGAVAAGPQAYLLDFLPQEFDETFEDDELVYTLKGSFKLNPTTQIYGGFTHGFKSGGFNLDASAAGGGASPQFDSEKVDAWEFGVKTDFFGGRARANIAAFVQEMEDFQVLEFTGTQFQTFNVGKAESKGVEFEGLAQVSDNLLINLGLTYADAEYPDDCTPMDPNDPDFARNPLTLCGQPLTNAPEFVAILGGNYERNVFNNMNFFTTASVRYETERRTSSQPTEAVTALQLANANGMQPGLVGPADTVAEVMTLIASQPALPGDYQDANTKVNLRLGLESEDGRWAVELWGNNIFDERTKNVTFNIPLRGGYGDRARGQFVQDPATYGVTLRTNF